MESKEQDQTRSLVSRSGANAPLLPSVILARAADLIEPKGAWTRGHAARTKHSKLVKAQDPRACKWCIWGAIARTMDSDETRAADRFLSRALQLDHITDAFDWNDQFGRTQSEVVKALRDASELARSEGQ